MTNPWLAAGGVLNILAALAHLAVIIGGPRWYAFFGAGPRMVRLAEQGSPTAPLITLGIAAVLLIWAAFCFSGAGLTPRLPLTWLAIGGICAVYSLRAVVYIPGLALTGHPVGTFAWVSSAIVLVFAVVHILGAVQLWRA